VFTIHTNRKIFSVQSVLGGRGTSALSTLWRFGGSTFWDFSGSICAVEPWSTVSPSLQWSSIWNWTV